MNWDGSPELGSEPSAIPRGQEDFQVSNKNPVAQHSAAPFLKSAAQERGDIGHQLSSGCGDRWGQAVGTGPGHFCCWAQPLVPPSILLHRHHQHFILGPLSPAPPSSGSGHQLFGAEPRGSAGTWSRPPPRQPSPSSPSRGSAGCRAARLGFPPWHLSLAVEGEVGLSAGFAWERRRNWQLRWGGGEEEKRVGAGPYGWSTGGLGVGTLRGRRAGRGQRGAGTGHEAPCRAPTRRLPSW